MVALNDKFAGQDPWCGPAPAEFPRGAVSEAYDTDAYGNTQVFTGPGADGVWFTDDDVQSDYGANDTIFQGRQYDSETQLYYFRTRYYVPALGRFVDRNPWGYIQGRYDLYDFEKCNPLSFVEPFSVAIPVGLGIFWVLVVVGGVILIHEILTHGRRVHFRTYCPPPPDPCPGLIEDLAKTSQKYINATNEVMDDNKKLGGWPGPPRGSPEWMKLYYKRAKTLKELTDLAKELNDISNRMRENGC